MPFHTVLALTVVLWITQTSADYWSDRADILTKETSELIGSQLTLSAKELQVNTKLLDAKTKEYDQGLADPSSFLPSIHFFIGKPRIEQSDVFKFIQKVPKGASLHSHTSSLVSNEFLYNLTFRENLYGCFDTEKLKMRFIFQDVPSECQLLSELRNNNDTFDEWLKSQITLETNDPDKAYPNINTVWAKFDDIFSALHDMLNYKPVFQDFLYRALQELHEDNVMYLEIRGGIDILFDETKTYTREETVSLFLETIDIFKKDHPDFLGARLIYSKSRNVDNTTFESYAKDVLTLKQQYPGFIAGFDLVGQEDLGQPLSYFVDQIVQELAGKVKFFFHAGETDWDGSTDLNLVDAVLLNSTRIGHGYGIIKHQEVLRQIKEKQIAIELNPVSNQVLKLVNDLRNHVGTTLMAGGYPVVVCNDDPGLWGAKGLSYDWYMAFMGMTPRMADLRVLKQLALNSLMYSSMEEEEKQEAIRKWNQNWEQFLDDVLADDNN